MLDVNKRNLESFFDLPLLALSKGILERYIEITTDKLHLSMVPHKKEFDERLLKPLRSAKKNYCLGDYLATIASCGIVGEMLAILVWKSKKVSLKGNLLTEEDEKCLFGSSFEKLGQKRRLEVLKTFYHINDSQYKNFLLLKNNRRPYLHLWTADLGDEKEKGKECIEKAFLLFKEIINLRLENARSLSMNSSILGLLKKDKTGNT